MWKLIEKHARHWDEPKWRTRLFALAAMIVGLGPFVVAEGLLQLAGGFEHDLDGDPFVEFSAIQPLFVLDETATQYEISPARQNFFRPQTFPAVKGADEFRIFCLGGSTVQGRPYATETAFTTWLQTSLRTADPNRDWRVINCGGISYASYRLVPILQEVLEYEPDLIIIYTGHNEFLEDRTYAHIKRIPPAMLRVLAFAHRLRTYRALRTGLDRIASRPANSSATERSKLPAEVDALLDYRGGLDAYCRDPQWREGVIDHFAYNLRRMVQMVRDAPGSPGLILVNPVCDLRDCPPFKSEHRPGLSDAERQQWTSLWNRAQRAYRDGVRQALPLFRQAAEIDNQYAALYYEMGKCYEAMHENKKAYCAYLRAKDLDICPLRVLEPMNQAILRVAQTAGVPLVDVRRIFEEHSPQGIPGGPLLVDHVHPSIQGHQIIANALASTMVEMDIVQPQAAWEEQRDRAYRTHLESLDALYFLRSEQRLRNLRLWTQGRMKRIRSAPDDA